MKIKELQVRDYRYAYTNKLTKKKINQQAAAGQNFEKLNKKLKKIIQEK